MNVENKTVITLIVSKVIITQKKIQTTTDTSSEYVTISTKLQKLTQSRDSHGLQKLR